MGRIYSLVSYNPNLRLALWKDEKTAKSLILEYMPYADIIKISDEEFMNRI